MAVVSVKCTATEPLSWGSTLRRWCTLEHDAQVLSANHSVLVQGRSDPPQVARLHRQHHLLVQRQRPMLVVAPELLVGQREGHLGLEDMPQMHEEGAA